MALYRCAACGSPNVVTDQENDGIQFDYVKGAIGTVVLGSGGAVAGISNKSKLVFKCRDCGVSLSYPLGEPYKTLIDTGVASMAGRQTLNINGFPMSWDTIKGKFPNIESGPADSEIEFHASCSSRNKKAAVEYLMTLWKKDNADDMIFLQKSEDELSAAQTEWEENRENLAAKRQHHFQSAVQSKETEISALNTEKITKLTALDDQKDALLEETKTLEARLSTLGIFKFSEKSSIKNQIAQNTARIESLKAAIATESEAYDKKITSSQRNLTQFQRDLNKKLDVIYAAPESPKDRFVRIKQEQSELNTGKISFTTIRYYEKRYYLEAIKYQEILSDEEAAEIFNSFLAGIFNTPGIKHTTKSRIGAVRRSLGGLVEEVWSESVIDKNTFEIIQKSQILGYTYSGL